MVLIKPFITLPRLNSGPVNTAQVSYPDPPLQRQMISTFKVHQDEVDVPSVKSAALELVNCVRLVRRELEMRRPKRLGHGSRRPDARVRAIKAVRI
jgi:hypothetical protein